MSNGNRFLTAFKDKMAIQKTMLNLVLNSLFGLSCDKRMNMLNEMIASIDMMLCDNPLLAAYEFSETPCNVPNLVAAISDNPLLGPSLSIHQECMEAFNAYTHSMAQHTF